jgi:hypothetical protein
MSFPKLYPVAFDGSQRGDRWARLRPLHRLTTQTIGLLGLGAIGQLVFLPTASVQLASSSCPAGTTQTVGSLVTSGTFPTLPYLL